MTSIAAINLDIKLNEICGMHIDAKMLRKIAVEQTRMENYPLAARCIRVAEQTETRAKLLIEELPLVI